MLLVPQSSSPAYTSNISHVPSAIIMYVMFTNYSFVFSILWTLCLFGASFCASTSLFSTFYRLFCKNTGGWVPLFPAKLPPQSCFPLESFAIVSALSLYV